MFRIISAITFVALVTIAIVAVRSRPLFWRHVTAAARLQLEAIAEFARRIGRGNFSLTLAALRRLAYAVAFVSLVILSVSGFLPVMLGSHVSGVALLFHVTLAPVFAVALALLAVLWAHRHRFEAGDAWRWHRTNSPPGERARHPNVWQKLVFWVIMLSCVPLLLSIVVSMTYWFGTGGQDYLLRLHGYAALVIVAAAVLHVGMLLLPQQQEHEVQQEPIVVAAEDPVDD